MPICGLASLECVASVVDEVTIKEAQRALSAKDTSCNCLQACNSVQYSFESSKLGHNQSAYLAALGKPTILHNVDLTQFNIQLSGHTFYGIKRMELYTFTELISNCGGVMSLFIGFSVFSLIETLHLIYVVCLKAVRSLGKLLSLSET